MARLGAFCFAGTGHINPMTALARRLQARGHEVILFGIRDIEARVRAAGVGFCPIGGGDYPLGTLARLDRVLAEKKGLETFRFTVDRVKNTALMVLREGPPAVCRASVDALLVDEADMGGSVAEYLGVPFVSIAFFPPLIRGDHIPPFCFGWKAGHGHLSHFRNRLGMRFLSRVAAPIYTAVNAQRVAWGLKHGRPLIYASLGTLQNAARDIFRKIAQACAGLDAQLVISLGGGLDPDVLGRLPGDPLVVRYAPQLELVKRAAAVITYAGLNTTLEALAEGVPLICIPLGNDQPGVAARVAAHQAGIIVPRRKLTVERLRSAILSVLNEETYRAVARRLQIAMQQIDGLEQASNIIEHALKIGVPADTQSR